MSTTTWSCFSARILPVSEALSLSWMGVSDAGLKRASQQDDRSDGLF